MSSHITPETVVAAYFEHIRTRAYRNAADLMVPICIRRFMEHEEPTLRPPPIERREEYVERNTHLPREVAEHFFDSARARPGPTLSDYFAGVETESELAELEDRERYARHLQATDPADRYRRYLAQVERRYPAYAEQLGELRARDSHWSYDIIGAVTRGERACVLFESPPGDHAPEELAWEPSPSVAVLRRTGGGWGMAADPNPFKGMGLVMAPVPVTDPNGARIWLDLHEAD